MKPAPRVFFSLMALLLASLACSLPFAASQSQDTPTALPVGQPSPPPAVTLPASTSIPLATNQAGGTAAAGSPSLASAVLLGTDFPSGFTVLDAKGQAQIGVTQDTVAGLFQGTFSQATPSNYFAFINPTDSSYQLVLGILFSPLAPAESAAFDSTLADPEKAKISFVSGLGSNASVLATPASLGDKSIGLTFTTQSNAITLRGDVVVIHRSHVVAILLTMYQDGNKPPADLISLAGTLDGRLQAALAH